MSSGRRRECAHSTRREKRAFFGDGPVACRSVEGRGVGGLGGLGRAGEVVPCGDDVGGEVLGEVGVSLEGGQGEFLVLVWYDIGCEGNAP